MPGRSFSATRRPCWNSPSERSNGRQVIRSPAVPPVSLVFRAALYSVGAVGAKTTWMLGFLASNAGMILSDQMVRSSLRQLSMVRVTFSPDCVWPCGAVVGCAAEDCAAVGGATDVG